MSKKDNPVVAAQGAVTTPPAEQTPPADEKKADETATDVLTALDALEADEVEETTDEWVNAQAAAKEIFEQYEDRNEVFVTIDAQGFWNEDIAAAQNMKYRKFERS